MSNTFQRTFQHLVDANTVLQSGTPPLPPIQRAPSQALPSYLLQPFLHHQSRNKDNPGQNLLLEEPPTCKDVKLLADGRHYTVVEVCQEIYILSWTPLQSTPSMWLSTASEGHTTILLMLQIPTPNKLSTKSSRWHPLLRPPTTGSTVLWLKVGTLPPATMSRLHVEDAVKKITQSSSLPSCRTLRGADMLLYDNRSDERRVIILATSDNLTITEESTSWYLLIHHNTYFATSFLNLIIDL